MTTLSPKGQAQRARALRRAKADAVVARKELAAALREARAVGARAATGSASDVELQETCVILRASMWHANFACQHVAQIESGIYSEGWV